MPVVRTPIAGPPGCSSVETLIGTQPGPILAAMDAAGDDVPNGAPAVPVAVSAVGMRRRDVVIAVADPLNSGRDVHAVCTIDLAATVPATHRGLHLSRLGDVVARSTQRSYGDLDEIARALARAAAESQYGEATATVWARIAYVEDLSAPYRSRSKHSLDHLHTMARATAAGTAVTTDVGVRVTHLVACPCVQKTYEHARRAAAMTHDPARAAPADPGPLLTHSQRCTTTVIVREIGQTWPLAEVLAALDAVLVRTRGTLPRDLELATVYRAHRDPQFIEDALRSAAAAVARVVAARTPFARLCARARSIESIHEFDLTASLVLTAAQCAALDAETSTIPPLRGVHHGA